MSEILGREEWAKWLSEDFTTALDARFAEEDVAATIEALAAALCDSLEFYDLRDASMRSSASQKVRNAYERVNTLREKGWIE